jgi:two-component system, OmpR family, sensor kinase
MPDILSRRLDILKGGMLLAVFAIVGVVGGFVEIGHAFPRLDDLLDIPLLAVLSLVNVALMQRWLMVRQAERGRWSEDLPEQVRAIIRNTSHELRTPITIARGYTELVWAASAGRSTIKDVEVVLDELDRLSRLTDRLLVLAVAGGPGFLDLDSVDLESLIVERAQRWGAAAARDWKVRVEDDQPLMADVNRLSSAIDALLENAVQHTRDGEEIAIEARNQQGMVVIEVRDGGRGIPPDQLVHLSRFLSDDGVVWPRRPGGTGLGLPMVKAIALAHHGWLSVSSCPVLGSTFSIHLRRTPVDGKDMPSESSGTESSS